MQNLDTSWTLIKNDRKILAEIKFRSSRSLHIPKKKIPSPWADGKVLVTRCWTSGCGCCGGCGHGLKLLALLTGMDVGLPGCLSVQSVLWDLPPYICETFEKNMLQVRSMLTILILFERTWRRKARKGKSGPNECQASRESEKQIVWTIRCRIKPCAR